MDFSHFNIKLPNGATGNHKVICPACTPHSRKPANKNSKDLSVNVTEGVWNCHNCGWKGSLKEKAEKVYNKPVAISLPLGEKTVQWFKGRGINENTLKAFKVTEKKEFMPQVQGERNCVVFPYIRRNEWVNAKYRDGHKNFKLTKGAELIIFNYDGIAGKKKVMITEGEIDAMSAYEAGFPDVCSVPNGATAGNQKLDYLDNSWQAFEDADEILIATDNDEAGNALRLELARRLGRERCKNVAYPDGCKDLNEVLVKHGGRGVFDCINGATPFPIEGIYRLLDFRDAIVNAYEHGFQKGVPTGFPEFDRLLNFSPGQVTIITGVPSSGKSAFLDQVLVLLSEKHGWRHGVCSFENMPFERHVATLVAVHAGKPFHRNAEVERVTVDELGTSLSFLHDHFYWYKMMDEDVTCAGILSRGRQLVKTFGINSLVIDPWNYMEHKRAPGKSETEYISEILSDISYFAKETGVHVFLVAHPTKIKKATDGPRKGDYEVPNLYDISGSAHFFNKTDNGITVWRNRSTGEVEVHVQKVRFRENGNIGMAEFKYDRNTGRYSSAAVEPFSPQFPVPVPDKLNKILRQGFRNPLEPGQQDDRPEFLGTDNDEDVPF